MQYEWILLYTSFFTSGDWSLLYPMFPPPLHFYSSVNYYSLSILLKLEGMEMG